MILQAEDCLDFFFFLLFLVLNMTWTFLFDHSCGHNRTRHNASNGNSMNMGLGGTSASHIHDATLSSFGGYFQSFFYSKHNAKELSIRDTHRMNFVEGDVGPFYMSKQEGGRKYDT